MFALLALAISLFGTQCWAQSCVVEDGTEANCFTFTQNNTTFTYTFVDGSSLIVHFDIVLRPFDLRVKVSNPTNPLPLDTDVFPEGTVCVQYPYNATNVCSQYDFTGNAGGPHGVPVRNTDYRHLITLELSYFTSTSQIIHNPAFGHAPGDIATFTEDILTGYFQPPPPPPCTECTLAPTLLPGDPVMVGDTPGLSSVIALNKPLAETDCFVWVSPTEGQSFDVGHEIEVEFRLATTCGGDPIRDKDARLSLAMIDSNGNISFPLLRNKGEGNKFHFDHEDGVNELDLSTEGLAPGQYTITVFSDEFSPQSRTITLTPRPPDHDHGHDHDHDPD